MINLSCGKGGENLTQSDKDLINTVADEFYSKIERSLKDITSFDVHVKCFQKEGNVKRFYINVRLSAARRNFDISAENWILHDAVKEAMEKLLSEIESKCHSSDNHGIGKRGKC